MSEEIEIKLIDHVGVDPFGNRVEHNQWLVIADGNHIGYLPKTENAWLACIVAMDEDVKQRIVEAVNRRIATEIGGVAMPPEPETEDDE